MAIRLMHPRPLGGASYPDGQPAEPAVMVQGLRKTYPGGVSAVKDATFEVARGQVFGLVGPNGAGKSTTIGMLTATVIPDSGSAWLAGIDIAVDPLRARRVSSVVFQEPAVDGSLTGRANLMLHARLWSVPEGKRRVGEMAELLDLARIVDRPVATFSGGERRRLEIARALVSRPSILFMDEPTVGLDTRIRYELLDIIATLRERENITVVLTTHYLEEAERLCDRVGIMYDGRIVALDTAARLLESLGSEVVEVRLDNGVTDAFSHLRNAGLSTEDAFAVGSTVTIPLTDAPARTVLDAIDKASLATLAVTVRRPTLDDVYLRLTTGYEGRKTA